MQRVKELEASVGDRRQELSAALDQLAEAALELNQLQTQVQTGAFKLEYESAIREMHDAH